LPLIILVIAKKKVINRRTATGKNSIKEYLAVKRKKGSG
jgi:hypothetical protein